MPTQMRLYFGSTSILEQDLDLDNWHTVDVATEEELIEFVNKGREAGGANLLEELLPSQQFDSRICLIANALNFGCQIAVLYRSDRAVRWPSRAWQWQMLLPHTIDEESYERIAHALNLKRASARGLLLPEPIGNAARAFDMGLAFQEYRN